MQNSRLLSLLNKASKCWQKGMTGCVRISNLHILYSWVLMNIIYIRSSCPWKIGTVTSKPALPFLPCGAGQLPGVLLEQQWGPAGCRCSASSRGRRTAHGPSRNPGRAAPEQKDFVSVFLSKCRNWLLLFFQSRLTFLVADALSFGAGESELLLVITSRSVKIHLWRYYGTMPCKCEGSACLCRWRQLCLQAGSVPPAFQERFPVPAALEVLGLSVP